MHHHPLELLHHVSECPTWSFKDGLSESQHLSLPASADVLSPLRLGLSLGVALSFFLYTLQHLIPLINCSNMLNMCP